MKLIKTFGILCSAALSVMLFGAHIFYTSVNAERELSPLPVLDYKKIANQHDSFIGMVAMPFKNSPKITGNEEMPEMPTPPSIPDMPGMGNTLAVIGILPPDVCILQRGGETLTARSGTQTKFGYVGSIDAGGAVVDGTYLNINR